MIDASALSMWHIKKVHSSEHGFAPRHIFRLLQPDEETAHLNRQRGRQNTPKRSSSQGDGKGSLAQTTSAPNASGDDSDDGNGVGAGSTAPAGVAAAKEGAEGHGRFGLARVFSRSTGGNGGMDDHSIALRIANEIQSQSQPVEGAEGARS